MKNLTKYTKHLFILTFLITLGSCSEDFLNRKPEDSLTVDSYYTSDDQMTAAVNPLYGGPWFDFMDKTFIVMGDCPGGNYWTSDGDMGSFFKFAVTPANVFLLQAYKSIWNVIAQANSIIENLPVKAGPKVSEQAKNTAVGEAMVWRAMAYFYLVRNFGAIPIIDSNTKLINDGTYSQVPRYRVEDVYEYIVRSLKVASDLLPEVNQPGRINKWSAYGLLAKVYLTRSGYGRSGSRNPEDLAEAKKYAGYVVNSSLKLEPEYANLFTISKGNRNPENLISWHWIAEGNVWGTQNTIQAYLAPSGMTGTGDGWGSWSGPTIDLQKKFGEDASKFGQVNRVYSDKRRKATMMMDGDFYPELTRDKGGFNVEWDGGVFASNTGALCRKHIVGNIKDHVAETGSKESLFMKTTLSTHILRLADVYLIYAEAILGDEASTNNPEALKAYNAVRKRAIPTFADVNSITFDDILQERRLELAFEGDFWYDLVRLHYYNPAKAKAYVQQQERGTYDRNKLISGAPDALNASVSIPDDDDFVLPFPEIDASKNPKLLEEPVQYSFPVN